MLLSAELNKDLINYLIKFKVSIGTNIIHPLAMFQVEQLL